MREAVIAWASGLSPELATVILAASPVFELRLSIPVAMAGLGLSATKALLFSYLGNILPMFLVFAVLPPVLRATSARWPWAKRLMDRYFLYLEHKHRDRYDRWGSALLFVLVTIPIPGSGVWTGTIVAVLFGVERRYAMPAIALGMVAAGLIVLGLTGGVIRAASSL